MKTSAPCVLESILTKPIDNWTLTPMELGTAGPETIRRCPTCRSKVVVEHGGEVVIHNAILRVDAQSDRVTAKCPRCKAWVDVPLRFVR